MHVSGTARTARFSPGMMGIERQICVSVGGQVLPSTETSGKTPYLQDRREDVELQLSAVGATFGAGGPEG